MAILTAPPAASAASEGESAKAVSRQSRAASPPPRKPVAEKSGADAAPQEIPGASDAKKESADVKKASSSAEVSPLSTLLSSLVWPGICALPLAFTLGGPHYRAAFPAGWYDEAPVTPERGAYGVADPSKMKPLGLILGILAVAVGHVFMVSYHAMRRAGWLGGTTRVQPQERAYTFFEGLTTHLAQPEGFALIGSYLIGTWMLGFMPASYYSFEGGINWKHVAAQLLLQDFFQYIMHFGEHKVSSWVYRNSHKPHHRFTNPRLFDAFDGSLTDTTLMIVIPFVIVARLVPANVWSYMTFGSLYANWLVLIHSEFAHPWDGLFRKLGFGTAGDHHVHHRMFVFNYGHLFMYWDRLLGTYKSPSTLAGSHFNKDV